MDALTLKFGLASVILLSVPALAERSPESRPEATAINKVSTSLITAREHFDDPAINSVSYRAANKWFPTEEVASGTPSLMSRRIANINPDVTLSGKAMEFDDALAANFTNAFLVMKNGVIIDERYLNGGTPEDRYLSWSMAKSITSILIGIAFDKGLIHDLNGSIEQYVPEMRGTAFQGVTIEQLLTMRDGTSYTEQMQNGISTLSVIRKRSTYDNRHRFTDLTGLDLTRLREPGGVFNYSTLASTILGRAVEGASGMSLAKFTERYLWLPAGMESPAYWLLDGEPPEGRAVSGGGFSATLRDYGRIGQMMLDGGRANGKQIVSKSWVEKSTRDWSMQPVIPGAPRGYGYQWWTLKPVPGRFEAIGIHGQFMSIDSATGTVIVKLSYWPESGGRQYNMDTFAILDAARANSFVPAN